MKRYFVTLICLLSVFFSVNAQDEVPYSEFKITPHNRTHLKTREEYPVKTYFPIQGKVIDKVQLDLHLNCPDHGCSSWDYSINVVLRTMQEGNKRDFQLGRMITPYSGRYNQGKNASVWDHIWSWDITEYLPLMKDSVEIVVQYEGYQDGFLATTDFIFTVDNTKRPQRLPKFLDVQSIYYGYYPFGREDSVIDMFLPHKTVFVPKGTKKVLSRLQISGHGGDSLNAAAEFLKKNFVYVANGMVVCDTAVWREDCGCNPIQPQGGTWIYKRAGWCPGTKVQEHYFDLTPFVKSGRLDLKMAFEYYNGQNSGQAGYQITNDIFFIADKDYTHSSSEDLFGAGRDLQPQNKEIMILPTDFDLVIKTNNDPRNSFALYEGRLRDTEYGFATLEYEKKIYERSQMEANREYTQHVKLKHNDNYLLEIDDEACDGLSWWANAEQGDGYVLLYDKNNQQLLDAFDPDFGCELQYEFLTDSSIHSAVHKQPKLVMLQDKNTQTLRFIFFNREDEKHGLHINIVSRQNKETVLQKQFDERNVFDETVSYKDLEKGYYRVEITCGDYQEYKVLIKK